MLQEAGIVFDFLGVEQLAAGDAALEHDGLSMPRPAYMAAQRPAGPPPTMITSNCSQLHEKLQDRTW